MTVNNYFLSGNDQALSPYQIDKQKLASKSEELDTLGLKPTDPSQKMKEVYEKLENQYQLLLKRDNDYSTESDRFLQQREEAREAYLARRCCCGLFRHIPPIKEIYRHFNYLNKLSDLRGRNISRNIVIIKGKIRLMKQQEMLKECINTKSNIEARALDLVTPFVVIPTAIAGMVTGGFIYQHMTKDVDLTTSLLMRSNST